MKKRTEELKELIAEAKNKIDTYIIDIEWGCSHLDISEVLHRLIEERVKYEIELAKIGE